MMMEDEGPDRVRPAYRGNYDRLVSVKQRYDPTNLFHINHNIPPTLVAGRRVTAGGSRASAAPSPSKIPRAAGRSVSADQGVPSSARGSSLFRGRPSRASTGSWPAGWTGASSRQPTPRTRLGDGLPQPAELVDQPDLQGVPAGPHPAAGDRLDSSAERRRGPAATLATKSS